MYQVSFAKLLSTNGYPVDKFVDEIRCRSGEFLALLSRSDVFSWGVPPSMTARWPHCGHSAASCSSAARSSAVRSSALSPISPNWS